MKKVLFSLINKKLISPISGISVPQWDLHISMRFSRANLDDFDIPAPFTGGRRTPSPLPWNSKSNPRNRMFEGDAWTIAGAACNTAVPPAPEGGADGGRRRESPSVSLVFQEIGAHLSGSRRGKQWTEFEAARTCPEAKSWSRGAHDAPRLTGNRASELPLRMLRERSRVRALRIRWTCSHAFFGVITVWKIFSIFLVSNTWVWRSLHCKRNRKDCES